MGAVNFSLDPQLVKALQSALPLTVFVETGTFNGDCISLVESSFDRVVSIELSDTLYSRVVKRFSRFPHIQILLGNSVDFLQELKESLNGDGVLYWLDAHWCVDLDTAGQHSQCPLLGELTAIDKLNKESVILIDDARLFLAPPLSPHEISQWPSFQEILQKLRGLSTHHELMVVNDVIIFYPQVARSAMISYAQSDGVDWLDAAQTLREQSGLASALNEKERCIIAQNESLVMLTSSLKEKEEIIQDLKRTIRAYSFIYERLVFIKPIARLVRSLIEIFLPRLGNLYQYQPQPITLLEPVKHISFNRPLRISIVTPSFEQGDFISRSISSVLDQEYPNVEYFVQDGGSSDLTIEVLKKYENMLAGWESTKDSGQSQAINRGFKKTSGDIMGWLNSDDLLLPGALQTVSNFFQENPNVDVVYGNRLLIDESDMEIGRWIIPGHDSAVLTWVDFIPQETMFWRRSIWEQVGGQVDETFRFAMDWDLLLRFRDAGASFAHIPRFLGAFRIHDQQKTSAEIHHVGKNEMDCIRARLLGYVPTHEEINKAITLFLLRHIFEDLRYRIRTRMRGFGL
jgi:hypothetical protein